jgi:D-methionine transport system substrate-binding protein
MKKYIYLCLISFILLGCHPKENAHTVTVGTIAGPETELMQVAQKVALKRFGLTVVIKTFNDYIQPNQALHNGDIDANSFQHQPYLDAQNSARHYGLVSVGKTFLFPMGIYSHHHFNLKNLPRGTTVAIPNDPSNEARALLLLQQEKLITLRRDHSVNATINDIIKNPDALHITTLNAALLPRALDDVSLAVINTTYALPAGLNPQQSLAHENTSSPYTNIIVTTRALKNSSKIQQLIQAFHSKSVLNKAKQLFHNNAIAGFSIHSRAT